VLQRLLGGVGHIGAAARMASGRPW
jgi:hypothetical protein